MPKIPAPDAPADSPAGGVDALPALAKAESSANTGAVAPGAQSPELDFVPPTRKGSPDKEWRILRAAAFVFAEHGYHSSRMSHVAKRAGVATGTIYLYFKSKTDLLVRLFRRSLGEYLVTCRPILEATPPGVERVAMLVALHFRFFDGNRALATVFLLHVREPDPAIQDGIRETVAEFFALIADIVRSGIEAGEFDPNLDVRLTRKVFFGSMDEAVVGWLRTGCRYDLMTVAPPLAAMLCRAAGATRIPPKMMSAPSPWDRESVAKSGAGRGSNTT